MFIVTHILILFSVRVLPLALFRAHYVIVSLKHEMHLLLFEDLINKQLVMLCCTTKLARVWYDISYPSSCRIMQGSGGFAVESCKGFAVYYLSFYF